MKTTFKIPFLLFPQRLLEYFSGVFLRTSNSFSAKNKKFREYFSQAEFSIKPEEYLATIIASTVINFIFLSVLLVVLFVIGHAQWFYALVISFVLCLFMFIQQINYPRLLILKKVRNIEVNLLPAIRAMTVQLTAGVTFFNALKNISKGNYGAISEEFKKAVNGMESGISAVEALEKISRDNPSLFFRRAIWQIITGMQVGADISNVLKEIVKSLIQEQLTEIQSYGGKLSPLSMFYMVIAIIFPALSITFVLILSTFVQVLGQNYKIILFSVFGMVLFLQVMFLGMIKSGRPPLI